LSVVHFDQARNFIFADVQRELQLAAADPRSLEELGIIPGGGNFLAALGLLCYTEFGGRLRTGRNRPKNNFNSFFDRLGEEYAEFRKRHDVYDIFRCGLAHEYFVKESCIIAMFAEETQAAIGYDAGTKRYWFVVGRYAADLARAFGALRVELYGS
jgi:hypothetical protein